MRLIDPIILNAFSKLTPQNEYIFYPDKLFNELKRDKSMAKTAPHQISYLLVFHLYHSK